MKSLQDTQTEAKLEMNKLEGQTKAMEVRLINRIQDIISCTEDKIDKIHTIKKMLNKNYNQAHNIQKIQKTMKA